MRQIRDQPSLPSLCTCISKIALNTNSSRLRSNTSTMEDEHSDIDDSESDTMTACSEDSTPQNSSQDSTSLRKDEESTILDYARRHGLCQDYRSRNPLDSITLPSPIPEKALDFDYFGGLADLELPSSVIQDERWTLDQGGAQYLQSILPTLEDHSNFEYPAQRHKFRRLKLECPLLKTDDQLDMKKLFARRQKPLALDTIQLDRIPDAKGEEGLQWPTCDPSLLTRKDQEARSETLQASFADMSYLRDTLEVSCDECEVEAAIQLELQRHKVSLSALSSGPHLTGYRTRFRTCHHHCRQYHQYPLQKR